MFTLSSPLGGMDSLLSLKYLLYSTLHVKRDLYNTYYFLHLSAYVYLHTQHNNVRRREHSGVGGLSTLKEVQGFVNKLLDIVHAHLIDLLQIY